MKLTFLSFNIEGSIFPGYFYLVKNKNDIYSQIKQTKFYDKIKDKTTFENNFYLFVKKYKRKLLNKKQVNEHISETNYEFDYNEKTINILKIWLYTDTKRIDVVDLLYLFINVDYYKYKIEAISQLVKLADVDFILFQNMTPPYYFELNDYHSTVIKTNITNIDQIDANCDLTKKYKLENTGNVIYFKKKFKLRSIINDDYLLCVFECNNESFNIICLDNCKFEYIDKRTIIAGTNIDYRDSRLFDLFEYHGKNKKNKYTIDNLENNYFKNDIQRSRTDKVFITKDLSSNEFHLAGKKHYLQLQNMMRISGCISNHYALYFSVLI